MKASNHCIRLLDDFVEQIKTDQRFNISLIFSSASGPFHYYYTICVYFSALFYFTLSHSYHLSMPFDLSPSFSHLFSFSVRHLVTTCTLDTRITRACLFAVKVIIFIKKTTATATSRNKLDTINCKCTKHTRVEDTKEMGDRYAVRGHR